jgi:hypothetical protein
MQALAKESGDAFGRASQRLATFDPRQNGAPRQPHQRLYGRSSPRTNIHHGWRNRNYFVVE